jgi:nitrogen-specific signal transduction histidine kinase
MSRRPLRLGIRTRELLAFSVLTLAVVGMTTLVHLAVVTDLTLDQVEQESKLLAQQVLALARNRVADSADPSAAAALASSDALQTLLDAHVEFSRYAVYVTITGHDGRAITTSGGGASLLTEIELVDDGPGIPADQLERIFELDHTTKEDGTGVGLFLVHRIVQQHGGLISASSEIGRGSRFTVRLPRRDLFDLVGDDGGEEETG